MVPDKNKLILFDQSSLIIEENGKQHSVKSILSDGDELFLNIPSKSLVLLLCKNQLESILFYINSIERSVVPILIDSKLEISLLNNLINKYNPDFIFSPTVEEHKFIQYSFIFRFRNYTLLKRISKINIDLNPELALLLSTSGTTGSPKLVRLSYKNLITNAASISDYLHLNKSEKAISSLPMNYAFGLSIINSHLYAGGSVLMTTESITQRRFWDLFNNFQITSFSGVPYTFEILKKFKLLEIDLPYLKVLSQAGGKLSNELLKYFANISLDKKINFYLMYGQTEGTARLSYLPPNLVLEKIGSIGKPINNGQFHLIDKQNKRIVRSGTSGELIYSGPNVMLGYSEELNDLSKGDENNGFLKTGDIAYFDEDGYYFIVGRINRFIKILGNRVNLDDLEKLLLNFGVECACIGRENFINIFIVNSEFENLTKELLFNNLGIHFTLFEIRVIKKIPKNSSGKILYSRLSDYII